MQRHETRKYNFNARDMRAIRQSGPKNTLGHPKFVPNDVMHQQARCLCSTTGHQNNTVSLPVSCPLCSPADSTWAARQRSA